ncbi:MAG: anti-sigma factor [Mycobacterium sp.]|nr:anti-sigma factor [Mycobacterium sp.]
MNQPSEFELLELATPYALDAVSDTERADIERRLRRAPQPVAQAFDEEVRAVRETMTAVSSATAVQPPEELRARVLAEVSSPPVRRLRWRSTLLGAAAALLIGMGALGIGLSLRPASTPTTAEQVFAAPDVRTTSEPIPTGGTATVVYSRQKDAGVLVMNNVAPPAPGTVYQMWLLDDHAPRSAGTMNRTAVSPSTTAVLPDLGKSTALAFTVEPGAGSPQPTGAVFVKLPLT